MIMTWMACLGVDFKAWVTRWFLRVIWGPCHSRHSLGSPFPSFKASPHKWVLSLSAQTMTDDSQTTISLYVPRWVAEFFAVETDGESLVRSHVEPFVLECFGSECANWSHRRPLNLAEKGTTKSSAPLAFSFFSRNFFF